MISNKKEVRSDSQLFVLALQQCANNWSAPWTIFYFTNYNFIFICESYYIIKFNKNEFSCAFQQSFLSSFVWNMAVLSRIGLYGPYRSFKVVNNQQFNKDVQNCMPKQEKWAFVVKKCIRSYTSMALLKFNLRS